MAKKSRLGNFLKTLGNALSGNEQPEKKKLEESDIYKRVNETRRHIASKLEDEDRIMQLVEAQILDQEKKRMAEKKREDEEKKLLDLIEQKTKDIRERERLAELIAEDVIRKEKKTAQVEAAATIEVEILKPITSMSMAEIMADLSERLKDEEITIEEYSRISTYIADAYKSGKSVLGNSVKEFVTQRITFMQGAQAIQNKYRKDR
jgi:ribosome biogenesis GTPase A